MSYNWQQPDWPKFKYDSNKIVDKIDEFHRKMSFIEGSLAHLSPAERLDIVLQLMVTEAVKTSEIEGEYVSRVDVMSSIKQQLGLYAKKSNPHDVRAQGIAALLTHLRSSYSRTLTRKMLFEWHHLLLGYMKSYSSLQIGAWRTHTEKMQVVSGRIGKITVHFEAPPSAQIPKEMQHYIRWYNQTAPLKTKEKLEAPIRAGLAHLYFESIHPFEDGNGRIGRALSEKALSQSFKNPIPLSLSSWIEPHKKEYYAALKQAQSQNETTEWLIYFIDMLLHAQQQSTKIIKHTLQKVRFFDRHKTSLNPRQAKVLLRMFDAGHEGFEGGISAKKYMGITRCSKATATRDLTNLVNQQILYQLPGGGRNTHYDLQLDSRE